MKQNLIKCGFLVLGASIALNAFSEPVVESRSTTSSSDYPFVSSSSEPEVVETTTVNTSRPTTVNTAGSVNNPFDSSSAGSAGNTTSAGSNNVPPAVMPVEGAVQSVNTFNAMQQDIQDLRGAVEELQYKLQQLEQQQKDRYLDVDRRLQMLSGGTVSSGSDTASSKGSANTSDTGAANATNSAEEKAEYETAFNFMTKDKNFDKATKAFSAFVDHYPAGTYAPNAWYWLGKLYSFDTKNLTKSRDAFQQVVSQFPTSAKAADALYELGVTQDKLGDKDQAQKSLQAVSAQYPGTDAATKAEQYVKAKPH